MTALLNLLADLDWAEFLISLIAGVICLSMLCWVIGTGQAF